MSNHPEYRAAVEQAKAEIWRALPEASRNVWAVSLAALGAVVVGVVAIAGVDIRSEQPDADAVHARMVRDEPSPQLALPVVRYDQWRISAGTVDGGAPTSVLDEVDGGTQPANGIVYVDMVNDNATCVNCGSCGNDDSDAVDGNTGWEIGTGSGCVDGPGVTVDGRAGDLCCLSQGAARLVRVNVGRQ